MIRPLQKLVIGANPDGLSSLPYRTIPSTWQEWVQVFFYKNLGGVHSKYLWNNDLHINGHEWGVNVMF